jgi:prepilin-type N-terminal cleavage/methylation domain-containing protein
VTSPAPAVSARDEDGFTLIELVVTMAVAMIVLFAVLQSADVFATSTKTANDRTEAQDTARATVRQLVQSLRQARLPSGASTPIVRVSTGTTPEVVFASRSTAGADTWSRVCVSADGRSLNSGTLATPTYSAPSTSCSAADTAGGWSYGTLAANVLRDPSTVLTFDSASCVGGRQVAGTTGATAGATCTPAVAAITTVGIRFAVAAKAADTSSSSVVTDAVNLRNGATS